MCVKVRLKVVGMCNPISINILGEEWNKKLNIYTNHFVGKPKPNVIMLVGLVNCFPVVVQQFKIIKPRTFINPEDDVVFIKVLNIRLILGFMCYDHLLPIGMQRERQRAQ